MQRFYTLIFDCSLFQDTSSTECLIQPGKQSDKSETKPLSTPETETEVSLSAETETEVSAETEVTETSTSEDKPDPLSSPVNIPKRERTVSRSFSYLKYNVS